MRIALVTAHPDDAEIFAGGLIAAYCRMGAEVTILVATDGGKGGVGLSRDLAVTRAAEAREGAAHLGARLALLGYPDGSLGAAAGFVADLRQRLAEIAPDVVLSHGPNDYHSDHRAVARAASEAVSFHAPLVWLDTMMGVGQVPTHYIDITEHQQIKERAILAHASQEPDRFVQQSQLLGRFRASQCGHDGYAEAVRHDPVFPFADIRSLLPPAPPVRPVHDRSAGNTTPETR